MVDKGDTTPVAIIGAGPIGLVQAILLGNNGFKVHVFESKGDLRKFKDGVSRGRSINLTLSLRGLESLRAAGYKLKEEIVDNSVRAYGRIVHINGQMCSPVLYGTKGEAIYSINRLKLNQILLSFAESHPNITILFKHKLLSIDFSTQMLTVKDEYSNEEKKFHMPFTFGCDGANSTVRKELERWNPRFKVHKEDITHYYKELRIPPNVEHDYAMPANFIHVWPRGEFMMTALPNLDKSFNVTLFMPGEHFDSIKTKNNLLYFFKKHFPDLIDKIGQERLVEDFFRNPVSSLSSMKCTSHYPDPNTLILGDAAHPIIPLFGQGVNAGMEDCLIFNKILSNDINKNLHKTAQLYSDKHCKDAHAIADLSMENYREIRSHIMSSLFRFTKNLDAWFHWCIPTYYIPRYSLVVFTRIPYHDVVLRDRRQNIFKWLFFSIFIGLHLGLVLILIIGFYNLLKFLK